jgi:hypothetical protein
MLLALASLSMLVACAGDEVLVLACQGTTQGRDPVSGAMGPDEPISVGLIVNLTARTITGFRYPTYLADFPVAITAVNTMALTFAGSRKDGNTETSVTGTVDRITGDLQATYKYGSTPGTYSLKCRPTQRMF